MLSGSFRGSGAESNGISGTENWAIAGIPPRSAAASGICRNRRMDSLLSRGRRGRHRLQEQFLHTPGFDFRNDDLVGISAIHHMNHLEPAQLFTGMAEPAND